ncbi:MAG TPA: DUF3857 domain-containing protein [Thermoanaerobaculia bacterium]|nr:DUF3857 domain-containing protein [Thermoanaerobaculia bacterium]
MKTVPSDAGAEAVILDWQRWDDDEVAQSAEYYRIKILTEEGKKHAEIEIPYVPGYPLYTKITDLSARTIRPDGTILPFDGKIYDKVMYKARRSTLRAKAFTFADVQPGTIIEYRYIRRWTEGYLLSTYWPLQRDIPMLHAKLSLKPADTQGQYGSFFTYIGLPAGVLPTRKGNDINLEVSNMAALRPEAYMPPEEQLRARVNFFYTDSKVTAEKFWPMQSRIFAEEIERFIGKGGKADAQRLAQGETDRLALLRKIYAHAQSLRNHSFEETKTDQEIRKERIKEARNADDVLKKGSGFSTEINRAFVAMARAAGFTADAVRVSPRDEFFFTDKFPDANQMSGEIAVVDVDGKKIYLDPGTPYAPFGIVSWEKTAVAAIHILDKGDPVWLRLGLPPASDAVTRRHADLRIEDENLAGKITVTFIGQEALVRRLSTINEDEAARKKAIEDEVKEWFPDGATLNLTSVSGFDTSDSELKATFDVTLPNLVSSAGSKVVVPISVFTSKSKNPFAPATRTHPIYFVYANLEEDEVKLTVPEGMKVATLPAPETLDGGAITYRAETKRQEGAITFKRSTNVGVSLVDQKHYSALRNLFAAMTTADQQPLVLVPATSAASK